MNRQGAIDMAEQRDIPVVVLDVNLQTLKVFRDLGRKGVRIIAIVPRKAGCWEAYSRYCEAREFASLLSGGEGLLRYLRNLARELGCRPMLLPMNDDMVLFMMDYEESLRECFRFLYPDPATTSRLISKEGLRELAQAAGVPQPLTVRPRDYNELKGAAASLLYPALIKPVFSRSWLAPGIREAVQEGKVVRVSCAEELLEQYARIVAFDGAIVVQEEIPGDDENLVYYIGFFDENSQALASFVGVKERVVPIHYGSASYVVSRRMPEVVEQSVNFMRAVGYKGHVGIEYKYDARDGKYKLIEVNARYGLWDGMATLCGINFADLHYRHLLGQETTAGPEDYEEGVKWISFQRDFPAFLHYRKEGRMGVRQWLKSIFSGKRDYAVFDWDDLLPFFLSSYGLAVTYMAAIMKKVRGRAGLRMAARLSEPGR